MIPMQWRAYLRRIFYGGILCFTIYMIFFRRRSPRVFLTASDIRQFTTTDPSHRRIPRIIHQTWKTHQIPTRWNHTVQSVRHFNVDHFEYQLWTDDDIHKFVQREEPNLYYNTFLKYSLDIQRVDAFRYIVLYHLGGLYIDMDNGCLRSFDSLLNVLETLDSQSPHLAAFPRTSPIGISNGFMISTKGHPLLKILVSRLSLFDHNYLIDYFTVMLSAGPLYLSLNEFYFHTSSKQSTVRIIDEYVYSSIYTWHTPGNSWHGQDARVILYVYHSLRNYSRTSLYYFLLVIGFISIIILCRCCSRNQIKKS